MKLEEVPMSEKEIGFVAHGENSLELCVLERSLIS
jgi:hypothetical protein